VLAELTNQKSAVAVIAESVQSIVECDAGSSSSSSSGVQSKYTEMNAALLEVEMLAKNKLSSLLLQLRLVGPVYVILYHTTA